MDLAADASANMYDLNVSMGGVGSATVTHPPLSLTAAKELWLFWYGEEPDLSELLAPELVKSGGEYKTRRDIRWGTTKGARRVAAATRRRDACGARARAG